MAKKTIGSAIRDLKINQPFDLRHHPVTLTPPTDLSQNSTQSKSDSVEKQPSAGLPTPNGQANSGDSQKRVDQISTQSEFSSVKGQPSQDSTQSEFNSVEVQPSQNSSKPEISSVENLPSQGSTESKFDYVESRLSPNSPQSKSSLLRKDVKEIRLGLFISAAEIERLPTYFKNQVQQGKDSSVWHKSNGYLQRSHLFRILRLTLTPSEFVLFDYLYDAAWDGESLEQTRQSLSRIAERTSLSLSTIKLGLRSLEVKFLIKCVKIDMKNGNVYRVAQLTKPNSDQVENKPGPGSTSTRSENNQPLGRNSTTCKELLGKELSKKNSLSEKVEEYFQNLKSPAKQKSEREAFKKIEPHYPIGQIEKGLHYLLENGIPAKGEICHSPMAFLTQGIDQVLKADQREEERQSSLDAKIAKEKAAQDTQAQKAEREKAEEKLALQEAEELERLFGEEYPTSSEQAAQLSCYVSQLPFMNPNGPVFRKLAIKLWWRDKLHAG